MTEEERDRAAKELGVSPDVWEILSADVPGGTRNLYIADTGGSPPGRLLVTPENIGPEYFELDDQERFKESLALRRTLDYEIQRIKDRIEQQNLGSPETE